MAICTFLIFDFFHSIQRNKNDQSKKAKGKQGKEDDNDISSIQVTLN
jgi:hypothetical protein